MSKEFKLPEILKELMEEHNLTAHQLAVETNIPIANIYEYLSGSHTPYFERFIKLLYRFNCSADYLLGLAEFPSNETLHPVPPFHKRLREVLKERKMSQNELRLRLDVSTSVMYKWTSGKSLPLLESIIRIANALDCSVDYLIGRVH